MRKFAVYAVSIAILLLAQSAMGQGGGPKKPKNPVVISMIGDADPSSVSNSIRSDGAGNYVNGSSSVVSQIQNIGDWELDMLASSTRRAYIDFGDPVAGTNPDPTNRPAPPSGFYPVRFITQCPVYGYNLLDLANGATAECAMIVAVDIGTTRYSLRFYAQNWPGSDNIAVTCNSFLDGKCNSWSTESSNDAEDKLIATVVKVTTSRGKTTTVDYGKFRFSFNISFVKT